MTPCVEIDNKNKKRLYIYIFVKIVTPHQNYLYKFKEAKTYQLEYLSFMLKFLIIMQPRAVDKNQNIKHTIRIMQFV